ncbi:hypothetical protein VNO78_31612 [Psophocarpus tetragonolobus]|uniref:Uncharacterized protein n=1 Tax=Psophocarpus tetragonolobus TaxID=3891 RepID=A0AAN9RZ64_PSOTE
MCCFRCISVKLALTLHHKTQKQAWVGYCLDLEAFIANINGQKGVGSVASINYEGHYHHHHHGPRRSHSLACAEFVRVINSVPLKHRSLFDLARENSSCLD